MNLSTNFEDKVSEINKYFDLLQFLDGLTATTIIQKIGTGLQFSVDAELFKTLKANSHLILYNLVEGTLVEGLNEIFETINSDTTLHQQDLTRIYKKIWLSYKNSLVELLQQTQNQQKVATTRDNVLDELDNFRILAFIENKGTENEQTFYNYDAFLKVVKSSEISGNLDARKIREEINKRYDLSDAGTCNDLLKVKNYRNKLAHGEETFSRIGSQESYQELKEMKDNVIVYLRKIVEDIEGFIANKKYCNPS
ncbi:MAG: hypothetical protein RLZZ292_1632 [Bacteroidota bacterium]|jgi:hypothetical protein